MTTKIPSISAGYYNGQSGWDDYCFFDCDAYVVRRLAAGLLWGHFHGVLRLSAKLRNVKVSFIRTAGLYARFSGEMMFGQTQRV